MFCPKCGKELPENAKFCAGCGEPISQIASPETSENVSPVESVEPVQSAANSVPVGNVITGTLPAQDTAPAEPVAPAEPATPAESASPVSETVAQDNAATATATLPEMPSAVQGSAIKPEKQPKSMKKTIIGVGAAAVGVVVVGVGVAGFTCAKADFAHLFMGNKKYAASLMGKQIEQVVNSPALSAGMINVSDSEDGETDSTTKQLVATLKSLKSVVPADGAQITLSMSAELSDESLESFADKLSLDTETAKKMLDAARSLKLSGGIKFSESGISASAAGKESGDDLLKVNAFYDADTKAYYLSFPGVSDECLKFENEDAVIDMEELNSKTDDKAAKDMITDVLSKYKDSLKDAEITYGKGTFSIGDVEFKGKVSSVTFEDDKLADMVSDVSEAFLDSDYAESLGDTTAVQKSIDAFADSCEDNDTKLVIENFVNSNNSVAGMRMELTAKENGEKRNIEIAYLTTKDGIAFVYEVDGVKYLEFSQDKENKTTGKFTAKLSNGRQNGKITVDYENMKQTKMFGQNVVLGDFTAKFSGEIFEGGDSIDRKITLKITNEDDNLNYSVGVKAGKDTVNFKMVLAGSLSEQIDAESMKISGAISSDDSEKVNALLDEIVNSVSEKMNKSEFFGVEKDGVTLGDALLVQAKRELRARQLVQNYSDYTTKTVSQANQIASRVYSAARSISYPIKSREAVKVKLYYDKDGKLNILDNAGMSSIDNTIMEYLGAGGYKNAYVEIVLWAGRGPVCGVNVVMTDNSANLPANLPDAYSFLDKQYNWGTDEDVNYSGAFVVGAYPRLANGEGGTTKENDEKLLADVKTYSTEAQKAAQALGEYTGLGFVDGKCYVDFVVNDGAWRVYTTGGSRITGNSNELCNYMAEKVGEITANYVCVYFENGTVVGAIASNRNYYSNFAVDDFKNGSTEFWTFADGVVSSSVVVGTSPSLKKSESIPQNLISEMSGVWKTKDGSNSLTITADMLSNCKSFKLNRGSATITAVTVTLSDGTGLTYYRSSNSPNIYCSGKSYYRGEDAAV